MEPPLRPGRTGNTTAGLPHPYPRRWKGALCIGPHTPFSSFSSPSPPPRFSQREPCSARPRTDRCGRYGQQSAPSSSVSEYPRVRSSELHSSPLPAAAQNRYRLRLVASSFVGCRYDGRGESWLRALRPHLVHHSSCLLEAAALLLARWLIGAAHRSLACAAPQPPPLPWPQPRRGGRAQCCRHCRRSTTFCRVSDYHLL